MADSSTASNWVQLIRELGYDFISRASVGAILILFAIYQHHIEPPELGSYFFVAKGGDAWEPTTIALILLPWLCWAIGMFVTPLGRLAYWAQFPFLQCMGERNHATLLKNLWEKYPNRMRRDFGFDSEKTLFEGRGKFERHYNMFTDSLRNCRPELAHNLTRIKAEAALGSNLMGGLLLYGGFAAVMRCACGVPVGDACSWGLFGSLVLLSYIMGTYRSWRCLTRHISLLRIELEKR